MYLFLPGNNLFPSYNYRDKQGFVHGHRVSNRKLMEKNSIDRLIENYCTLIQALKRKQTGKIIIVPCYFRNVKVCKGNGGACKKEKLVQQFSINYSTRVICTAKQKLKKLIIASGIALDTMTIADFEQACLKESTKKMSKNAIIGKILGADQVHYLPDVYDRLGETLGGKRYKINDDNWRSYTPK